MNTSGYFPWNGAAGKWKLPLQTSSVELRIDEYRQFALCIRSFVLNCAQINLIFYISEQIYADGLRVAHFNWTSL